jgi:hypothetical protein
VLFDGTGEINAERSGPADYEIVHAAELELVVQGAGCDQVFDAILEAVGAIAEANQVGEAWDFLELGLPDRTFAPGETHDEGKGCVLPILFTFTSSQPF